MTDTPTTPKAALGEAYDGVAAFQAVDRSSVGPMLVFLRASGWDVVPSTEIERLRGVIQNKDQTIGTVMAEVDRLLADIAALRRVADAALALRKAENDSNETDFASDLWCKQMSDEFDRASREFDAALDALPGQQVRP